MNTKTMSYFEEKLWYRFIKVVCIVLFIYCMGAGVMFAINEFDSDYIVISLFAFILFPVLIYIGFEIIRRVFYYIIIGTIRPIDDNYFKKLKKYRFIVIGVAIFFIIIFFYGIWDAMRIDQQRTGTENSIKIPKRPSLEEIFGT